MPDVYCLIFSLLIVALNLFAQPGSTIELKKPEKYQNRTLASEKTTEGKIKKGKKFYQNTVTHYNYYFNANNRLNDIVNRAKESFRDDYTKLLPYYNYSLDITATDPDIDSIIYKCNAGILLHDLRNDWIDDLYFLMGKAYFLRKNFDSAQRVFLYINYAFAPKDEGYDIPIGSNASGNVFTIATKEKTGLAAKLKTQPRRNEDLIWVARNYLETGKPYEASAILEMLRSDPNFPERLQPELHEALSYLFYSRHLYDSAAFHLSKATDLAENKEENARRQFLTAQLYMLSDENENAEKYFTRSANHTNDAVMAVYANLNAITASGDSINTIDKKIAALMRLAKKDRYVNYRDIIYYAAGEAEMEGNNYIEASDFLKKSIKYNVDNAPQRSISFMLLGDAAYKQPDYISAKYAYDSVDIGTLKDTVDQQRLTTRLEALQTIVSNINIIHTEDSLQTVAKLPEGQRTALIKKMVRQLRKAQGLKDADSSVFINPAVLSSGIPGANAPTDLFAGASNAKGDWYFNNNSIKSSGYQSFKQTFGNRPNVDNWQRLDAVSKALAQQSGLGGAEPDAAPTALDNPNAGPQQQINGGNGEISYDAFLANLPLTDEQVKASNTKIIDALFANAKQFQNVLEDYNAAIVNYDSLNKTFPDNPHLEESLAGLFYCYSKLGRKASADSALLVLKSKFKDGNFTRLLSNPVRPKDKIEDSATVAYENVYNLFIEGNFEQAKAAKAKADSSFGHSYWTPQLLYIESIYYVSKREDSSAINTLTDITQQFASSPLSQKAQTMIDVLHRRKDIESYLTNLQITRLSDDEPSRVINLNPVENLVDKKEIKRDSVVSKAADKTANPHVDSIKAISGALKSYVFTATDQQFVGIILNKVDPVYANETKNAFNRYNKMNFYSQTIGVSSSKINDSLNIVLLGPFTDAASALIYVDKVKPYTAGTIIPWLKQDKYSFTIISQSNLDFLNSTQDLQGYKSLIDKVLPGKF